MLGYWLTASWMTLGLTDTGADRLADARTGKNGRHRLAGLLRQSVFGRLAGYEDVNDADRLCCDPAMRWVVGDRAITAESIGGHKPGIRPLGRDGGGASPALSQRKRELHASGSHSAGITRPGGACIPPSRAQPAPAQIARHGVEVPQARLQSFRSTTQRERTKTLRKSAGKSNLSRSMAVLSRTNTSCRHNVSCLNWLR